MTHLLDLGKLIICDRCLCENFSFDAIRHYHLEYTARHSFLTHTEWRVEQLKGAIDLRDTQIRKETRCMHFLKE